MDIPGFKLGRQYADGHYCKGYNALNLSNHKTVNIQVFDPALAADQTFADQFREITGKLVGTSFGIMTRILQAEISDHACYVISDYFPGPQQLPPTPPDLTRQQIFHFALQLAQTLDQLHKAGLVHGGIEYSSLYFKSPDNLQLRPVPLQRVIPMLRPMTFKSLGRAQKPYLAPEAGEALTPATDYYALGVLLYQLVFDSVPADPPDSGLLEGCTFEGKHQYLESFFRQLLAIDAGDRIRNLDQFSTALRKHVVLLHDTPPSSHKAVPPQTLGVDSSESASSSLPKWIIAATGVAGIALAGTLYLLPREDIQAGPGVSDSQGIVVADEANITQEQVIRRPDLVQKESGGTPLDPDNLYQQALTQMEMSPKAALSTLNVVLKQKPDHSGALELKQRIEREISVRSIIDTAERQLRESKLLAPGGDNAYESYLALADMLSAEDERVGEGFTRIATAYHGEAENMYVKNRLDKAEEYVELGLSVKADFPPLLKLRSSIYKRRQSLAKEKRLAEQKRQRRLEAQSNGNEDRQRQDARLLVKQQRKEELTHRLEEQVRQAELQARQREVEQSKQARVDALLTSVSGYLDNVDLSLDMVFAAHRDYEELRKLDSDNLEVGNLRKGLIEAYTTLGARQNSSDLFDLALRSLKQGIQMSPQDWKKLQIISRLSR